MLFIFFMFFMFYVLFFVVFVVVVNVVVFFVFVILFIVICADKWRRIWRNQWVSPSPVAKTIFFPWPGSDQALTRLNICFFFNKVYFHDSVSRRIMSFQIDWTPLSKTDFCLNFDPRLENLCLFFSKKCIFTIVFLGESRHSELIGPPFQRPILKKKIRLKFQSG